jgi:1-deoxy-D-xylulose-5-phosphate synthase
LSGGFGESIKSLLCSSGAKVVSIGLPDEFIEHGNSDILRKKYGLCTENIVKKTLELFEK